MSTARRYTRPMFALRWCAVLRLCLCCGVLGCSERVSSVPDAGGLASSEPAPPSSDAADDAAVGEGPACGPEGECDLWAVDSCEAGRACRLLLQSDQPSAAATTAEPMCAEAGGGRDGEDCDRSQDCGPGLDCTTFNDAGGSCRRPCCELNQTGGCPTGQFCRTELVDADDASTDVALCDSCDDCKLGGAAGDSDCPDDQACYPLGTPGEPCRACLPAGDAAPGEACEAQNDCAADLLCIALGGAYQCTAACSLDLGGCPDDLTCTPIADGPLDADQGLCL